MQDMIISQYVNYNFYCNSLTGSQYQPPHPDQSRMTLHQISVKLLVRYPLCHRVQSRGQMHILITQREKIIISFHWSEILRHKCSNISTALSISKYYTILPILWILLQCFFKLFLWIVSKGQSLHLYWFSCPEWNFLLWYAKHCLFLAW